jgi:DNA-binding Lrp family transcriptional regulator
VFSVKKFINWIVLLFSTGGEIMHAYVQIGLDDAKESEIYEALKALPEVKEVHILFGEWDIIAKLELTAPEALGTFVMEKIRSLPGVKLTSTMIIAK